MVTGGNEKVMCLSTFQPKKHVNSRSHTVLISGQRQVVVGSYKHLLTVSTWGPLGASPHGHSACGNLQPCKKSSAHPIKGKDTVDWSDAVCVGKKVERIVIVRLQMEIFLGQLSAWCFWRLFDYKSTGLGAPCENVGRLYQNILLFLFKLKTIPHLRKAPQTLVFWSQSVHYFELRLHKALDWIQHFKHSKHTNHSHPERLLHSSAVVPICAL